MRVLVTGAGGFVGRHTIAELESAGHDTYGFDQHVPSGLEQDHVFPGDLRDTDGLSKLIARLRPDGCIHLAGIAFVPMGWTDPELVFSINTVGTINLLEALRAHAPKTRTVVASSSEVYGRPPVPSPLSEDSPMVPDNPYAASKIGADLTALLYARRYGMPLMTARPDNHIGPGQSSLFVAVAFAEQLADMSLGRTEHTMRVGNLESERDFTDVRDVVRAYRLLLEGGRGGEAYNIASGKQVRIKSILDILREAAGVEPKIEIDPERYRPDVPKPLLDTSKILGDVQWKPEIALEGTLRDVYQDVRERRAGTGT